MITQRQQLGLKSNLVHKIPHSELNNRIFGAPLMNINEVTGSNFQLSITLQLYDVSIYSGESSPSCDTPHFLWTSL